jgi:hypothetical protein
VIVLVAAIKFVLLLLTSFNKTKMILKKMIFRVRLVTTSKFYGYDSESFVNMMSKMFSRPEISLIHFCYSISWFL